VKNNVLCHERLAIVGVDSGAQPLINDKGTVYLCVNGEIYNHEDLRKKVTEKRKREGKPAPVFKTGSDCEVILHLVRLSILILV
jgi:asparagine synthase (glutamine-hydrolysing)